HKTERGLVHLSLADAGAVRQAFAAIRAEAGDVPVLVAEMLPTAREFMAGVTRVPGFGPVVLFGLGGIQAEALGDRAVRLAPLSHGEALELVRSIRGRDLLGAFRGMEPVDEESLASLLINLGNLATATPGIQEIDANPILIKNGRPVVADALFVPGE
ncbi:MAG: acetate--CoA ligase family protein, partial [Pseudomonadota bacterium]